MGNDMRLKEKPQERDAPAAEFNTGSSAIRLHPQEARSKQVLQTTRWISFFRASFQNGI
jgi:hypothetical protein